MEFCRFCGAEMTGVTSVCPSCGKDNAPARRATPVEPLDLRPWELHLPDADDRTSVSAPPIALADEEPSLVADEPEQDAGFETIDPYPESASESMPQFDLDAALPVDKQQSLLSEADSSPAPLRQPTEALDMEAVASAATPDAAPHPRVTQVVSASSSSEPSGEPGGPGAKPEPQSEALPPLEPLKPLASKPSPEPSASKGRRGLGVVLVVLFLGMGAVALAGGAWFIFFSDQSPLSADKGAEEDKDDDGERKKKKKRVGKKDDAKKSGGKKGSGKKDGKSKKKGNGDKDKNQARDDGERKDSGDKKPAVSDKKSPKKSDKDPKNDSADAKKPSKGTKDSDKGKKDPRKALTLAQASERVSSLGFRVERFKGFVHRKKDRLKTPKSDGWIAVQLDGIDILALAPLPGGDSKARGERVAKAMADAAFHHSKSDGGKIEVFPLGEGLQLVWQGGPDAHTIPLVSLEDDELAAFDKRFGTKVGNIDRARFLAKWLVMVFDAALLGRKPSGVGDKALRKALGAVRRGKTLDKEALARLNEPAFTFSLEPR